MATRPDPAWAGARFRIGRTDPLAERSDPAAWEGSRSLKTALDPDGLVNPGVLGG